MHHRSIAGVVAASLLLSCSGSGDDSAGDRAGAADQGPADASRRELPPVAEVGAELPLPEVTATLTSGVQQGWSIDLRGVARGPGDLSTLLLDVTRSGGNGDWPGGLSIDPEALGVEGEGLGLEPDRDLDGVSIVVPEEEWRYGVLSRDGVAASASDAWPVADGETMPAFALLPGLDRSVGAVTVGVPAFGEAPAVPVVEPPEPAGQTGDRVPATIRLRGAEDVRLDVLGLSRQGEGRGTLLQARLADERAPETPAGFPSGDANLCNVRLLDTTTLRSYDPVGPGDGDGGSCAATTGEIDGPDGDQQGYEVLFPDLPDDVEHMAVLATGYGPSVPVAVEDRPREPWLLTPPATLGDPVAVTLLYAEGPADGSASTTRQEEQVAVTLAADVLFPFDSAELTPGASARLDELAAEIDGHATAGSVTVTGHTDDVGDETYNQRLSEQRAEAVRARLEPAVGRGDLTFEATGRGESEPVARNAIDGVPNPDGQARNRRVTVVYTPA